MEETDSNSVRKFVFIRCLKKARKYKIDVSFILYNNIVIKLHRDVCAMQILHLLAHSGVSQIPMKQIINQWKVHHQVKSS